MNPNPHILYHLVAHLNLEIDRPKSHMVCVRPVLTSTPDKNGVERGSPLRLIKYLGLSAYFSSLIMFSL